MPARGSATSSIAALCLALAACGEDRRGSVEESGTATTATTRTSTTPSRPSGPVVATVKVRETEYELDPQNPRVPKAGLVQFEVENAGKVGHALEVEGPKGEVETETIAPGKDATLTADLSKAGRYVWYCPVADHEQRGMKGRISVGGAGAGTPARRHGGSGRRHDSRKDDRSGSPRRGDEPRRKAPDGTGGGVSPDGY